MGLSSRVLGNYERSNVRTESFICINNEEGKFIDFTKSNVIFSSSARQTQGQGLGTKLGWGFLAGEFNLTCLVCCLNFKLLFWSHALDLLYYDQILWRRISCFRRHQMMEVHQWPSTRSRWETWTGDLGMMSVGFWSEWCLRVWSEGCRTVFWWEWWGSWIWWLGW